jgi:hypothetical protein
MLTLAVMTFLGGTGCRARAPDASAALQKHADELTREQVVLRARIAVLEQTTAALQAASKAADPACQHASTDGNPSASPLAAASAPSGSISSGVAAAGTSPSAPKPTAGPPEIAVEDLGGQPPTASANSIQGLGVSDDQTRALLDQLNSLGQQFKSKQDEQKAALDALEGLR